MRKLFKYRTSIMDMNHWIIHSIAFPSIYPLFPLFSSIFKHIEFILVVALKPYVNHLLVLAIHRINNEIRSIHFNLSFIFGCHQAFYQFHESLLKFPERRFGKIEKSLFLSPSDNDLENLTFFKHILYPYLNYVGLSHSSTPTCT